MTEALYFRAMWAPLAGRTEVVGERLQAPRPMEPVIRPGRGMHVLGFVTQAMPMQALAPPPQDGASSASASKGGVIRGPSEWKRGRPVFIHGNYSNYYSERHRALSGPVDPRLEAVTSHLGDDVFKGKDVLDIGCNKGVVTLSVGRHFGASRAVGLDIDADLIDAASRAALRGLGASSQGCEFDFRAEDFMESPLRRSPDEAPEKFDIVLCLSVTKWIHFTHGDDGIRRLFKRIFKRLRAGGLLVLEPQEWSSYKKKRHLTPEIRETVAGIEMRPEHFDDCLLSLGFEAVGVVSVLVEEEGKNMQRRICLFRRPAKDAEEVAVALEAEHAVSPKLLKRSKRRKAEAEAVVESDIRDHAPKSKRRKAEAEEAVKPEVQEDAPKPKRRKAKAEEAVELDVQEDVPVPKRPKRKKCRLQAENKSVIALGKASRPKKVLGEHNQEVPTNADEEPKLRKKKKTQVPI